MQNKKDYLLSLLDYLQSTSHSSIRLYIVTRHLKEGIKPSMKSLNRHDFKLWQINIDDEIQKVLLISVIEKLDSMLIKKKLEVVSYEPLDDDEEKIYSYSIKNKTLSFNDILSNQMDKGVHIPKINNISEVYNFFWAYIIKLKFNNEEIFSFKKISKSKVTVESSKSIQALFSTTDSKLEILKGETITFDRTIDCISANNEFLIFNKPLFESLVALDDEFKEISEGFVSDIKGLKTIEGLDLLEQRIEVDNRLNKKIAKIVSLDDYKNLDKNRIRKMAKIAKENGYTLKLKNDNILLEDDKDVDLLIKILDDYFLESKLTGNKYGAFVKKRITVN